MSSTFGLYVSFIMTWKTSGKAEPVIWWIIFSKSSGGVGSLQGWIICPHSIIANHPHSHASFLMELAIFELEWKLVILFKLFYMVRNYKGSLLFLKDPEKCLWDLLSLRKILRGSYFSSKLFYSLIKENSLQFHTG